MAKIPWATASKMKFHFEKFLGEREDTEQAEWDKEKKEEDQRFKTIVCRHWLKSLCQSGERCDFLHKYVPERMPECRNGWECEDRESGLCEQRHTNEDDKKKCLFYKQGVCLHGPTCKFLHKKLPAEKRPEVADFSTPFDDANNPRAEGAPDQRDQVRKANWRTQMCRHHEQGGCPFQATCHYAHGQHELRTIEQNIAEGICSEEEKLEKGGKHTSGFQHVLDERIVHSNMSMLALSNRNAEYSSGAKQMARNLPDRRGPCKYFIARVADPSYQYLVVSVKKGVWAAPRQMTDQLNDLFHTHDNIFLFFSVDGTANFQGVARISAPVQPTDQGGLAKLDPELTSIFPVQWLRLCQLPFETVASYVPPLPDGTPAHDAQNYTELSVDAGRTMMELLFFQDIVELDPAQIEVPPEKFEGWGSCGLPEGIPTAVIGVESRTDGTSDRLHWVNGPGYIVGCDSYIIDECFGRMLFGMPGVYRESSRFIHPGTTLLLFHMHARKLLGIFQATSNQPKLLEPNAWVSDENSTSPYPVQIRFEIVVEVPVMSEENLATLLPDSNERVRRVEQLQMQAICDKMIEAGGGPAEVQRRNNDATD
jgi:cleavage and polyadenylation specificity factor subunit 4